MQFKKLLICIHLPYVTLILKKMPFSVSFPLFDKKTPLSGWKSMHTSKIVRLALGAPATLYGDGFIMIYARLSYTIHRRDATIKWRLPFDRGWSRSCDTVPNIVLFGIFSGFRPNLDQITGHLSKLVQIILFLWQLKYALIKSAFIQDETGRRKFKDVIQVPRTALRYTTLKNLQRFSVDLG